MPVNPNFIFRLHSLRAQLFYARHLIAVDFHHARAVQVVRNYVAYRHQHHGGVSVGGIWGIDGCDYQLLRFGLGKIG